jgi:3-methyladenine DNA glycosylase/8-oxoguanine DNA glycosylase
MLRYLAPRAMPGSERVEAGVFRRRIGRRWVEVRHDARGGALEVGPTATREREAVLERVARLFDLGHDPAPVAAVLRRSAVLRRRIQGAPGLRPLGAWSPFELCVRTVVGQQVAVAAANTLMRRLVGRCGDLSAVRLADANLAGIGMPSRRVESLQHFARAVAEGTVPLEAASWPEIEAHLRGLPGFGPWTRAYLAIRLGRDADAFPETDVGLMRAAGAASPRELLQMAEAWRPYRGNAAAYLWLPQ